MLESAPVESGAMIDLLSLLGAMAGPDVPAIGFRFPEGTTHSLQPGVTPRATVVLRRLDSLQAILERPDHIGLGEAFLRDDFDIEGDIEAIHHLADRLDDAFTNAHVGPSVPGAFEAEPASSPHDKARDAAAIKYHYDLSNTVFRHITGPTRMYSSAYFHSADDSLEEAQTNKLERVCQKLWLNPGETLLDIGCGWGGMVLYAAAKRQVQAVGVTISEAQAELCRERLETEDPAGRCQIVRADYRDIGVDHSPTQQPFDKIVSLGMVEHVGAPNLPIFFDTAYRALAPGGLFLLQGIASSLAIRDTRSSPFLHNYLFPDGDLPYLNQYLQAAQEAGFEVRDVENMREHYGLTHRHWRLNLEHHREAIEAEVGMARYRALRLLYSYSTHYFFRQRGGVYQVLLYKPAGNGIGVPLRRPL